MESDFIGKNLIKSSPFKSSRMLSLFKWVNRASIGLVLTHIRATCCYSNHEFSEENCYIKNEIERNILVVDMNAFSVHSFHLERSLYSVRLCNVYFRNCMLLIHFESLRSARSPERHISAFINIVWKKLRTILWVCTNLPRFLYLTIINNNNNKQHKKYWLWKMYSRVIVWKLLNL